MEIHFLGTGTSTGVPEIGCSCRVCRSPDPKDKRLRTSALVVAAGKRILIDCGPDFRMQMLRLMETTPFDHLDGVLITHEHYDHVAGMDELRSFCKHGPVDIYAEETVGKAIRVRMPYAFKETRYPGVPHLHLNTIDTTPFAIEGIEILPVRLYHGSLPILGYRIGNMAYLTDMKTIPGEEYPKLRNLDVLIIDALRSREHFSHQTIEEALANARKIQARQTYLIHTSHAFGRHGEMQPTLPPNVFIAYDGLSVNVEC